MPRGNSMTRSGPVDAIEYHNDRKKKLVEEDDPLVRTARHLGVSLGT